MRRGRWHLHSSAPPTFLPVRLWFFLPLFLTFGGGRFLFWIPLYYVFETALIDMLLHKVSIKHGGKQTHESLRRHGERARQTSGIAHISPC